MDLLVCVNVREKGWNAQGRNERKKGRERAWERRKRKEGILREKERKKGKLVAGCGGGGRRIQWFERKREGDKISLASESVFV